jgi:hypothetical protein
MPNEPSNILERLDGAHSLSTKVVEQAFWSQRSISGYQGHDRSTTEKERTHGLFGFFVFEQGAETAA